MRRRESRSYRRREAVLTLGLALPLLAAFVTTHQYYPVTTWKLFAGTHDLGGSYRYYVLRGVNSAHDTVDLRPTDVADPLSTGMHSFVDAVVENRSFSPRPARGELWAPHPDNIYLKLRFGGSVPPAARTPELLAGFGAAFNADLEVDDPKRLREVILEQYEWPKRGYTNYRVFVQSWEVAVE